MVELVNTLVTDIAMFGPGGAVIVRVQIEHPYTLKTSFRWPLSNNKQCTGA